MPAHFGYGHFLPGLADAAPGAGAAPAHFGYGHFLPGLVVTTPVVPGPAAPGADLMGAGLAWLTARLRAHASGPVTYTRGAASVGVRATTGRKLLKLTDAAGGVRLEWTDLDLLIPAPDLDFGAGAGPVTPRRGDRVTLVRAGEVQTFEVCPYAEEPPWRWSDPYQTMIRIHLKRVAAGTSP